MRCGWPIVMGPEAAGAAAGPAPAPDRCRQVRPPSNRRLNVASMGCVQRPGCSCPDTRAARGDDDGRSRPREG